MEITEALGYALDGQAILFAGSGFSYGAKNILNKDFETGIGLRNLLAKECGINKTEESLENVALLYKKKYGADKLVEILKHQFTLSHIEDYHKKVLEVKWKRIYTTNYDRVIEEAASSMRRVLTPVIVSDELDGHNKENVCVHINGYIERLTSKNLDTEFKLTEKSYAYETLDGKPWFEFMKADFKSAKAILIVGFSMKSDLDIQRLLSTPDMKEKVIYVTKSDLDEVSLELLKEYGACEQIGIQGFAEKIENVTKTHIVKQQEERFESFEHEYRNTFVPDRVELNDMVDLLYKGKFEKRLLEKNGAGEYKFLLYRKRLDFVVDNITGKKVFLVTSDLGNGKSMFCKLLRNELREKEIRIFTFRKRLVDLDYEIEKIASINDKHCVVIIDNYQAHFDIIRRFIAFGISRITFILTVRSAINHLNYKKLYRIMKIDEVDVSPVYLDTMRPEELEQLAELFKRNSISSPKIEGNDTDAIKQYLSNTCKGKFNNILLELFDSTDIKQRYIKLYKESAEENEGVRKLAIFALMKSTMDFELDFNEMCELLDVDYVSLSKNDSKYLNEIFDFKNNEVIVKSSIIAKNLLYSIIEIENFILVLIEVVKKADRSFRVNKNYEELLKNIVSHSHFLPFAINNKGENICKYYEQIRNTKFCKNNPFFWEQFASACIDMRNYPLAKQCLDNAFVEAANIDSFVPFQIETIYGKFIMEKLLEDIRNNESFESEDVINKIIDFDKHVMKYYSNPDNNVFFIFKNGVKYKEIHEAYKCKFDNRQKSIYNELLIKMIRKMDEYSSTTKDEYYRQVVTKWSRELNDCKMKNI